MLDISVNHRCDADGATTGPFPQSLAAQSRRRGSFRPLNTLHSKSTPTFNIPQQSLIPHHFPQDHHPRSDSCENHCDMVRERDIGASSSTEVVSYPQLPKREPLANISARVQQSSPRLSEDGDFVARSSFSQPEFGKASPLRNPVKRAESNVFVPKRPTAKFQKRTGLQIQSSESRKALEAASPQHAGPAKFRLPGEAKTQPSSLPAGAMNLMADYMSEPVRRPTAIEVPTNIRPVTIPAAPRPMFSSIGANTSYQPWGAVPVRSAKPTTSQKSSKNKSGHSDDDDDDDDEFDPEAAIRSERESFGTPDPYTYVDSTQAHENIKNLLEGAFDDEDDKSKTKLRSRAQTRKADDVRANESLADKLAALNVGASIGGQSSGKSQEQDEDEEDGTVEGLEVKLLPHQVEGVSWMIDKESGQRKKNGVLPYGGILADDMGLGKTVQSISLILLNPRPALHAKPEFPKQKLPGKHVSRCTLVVAPLALIKQWESEIKTKVSRKFALKVLIHHGPSRARSSAELEKYDVVITTYQTLTSEHAGSNMTTASGPRIGCFGVHWYRIMLDEAHSIKNRNAKSTQACCALNSWYRWCLTGTPMQNNLDELQSLINFLRIKPYCEFTNWKTQIIGPIKAGRGWLGMRRLQFFLKAFMKRRTKDILKQEGALNFGGKSATSGNKPEESMQIVKREVVVVECELDEAEQQFYDKLQARADQRLKAMEEADGKADYMGALVLLLRLRQACDHPHLIEYAMNRDGDYLNTGGMSQNLGTSSVNDIDGLAAMMSGVSIQAKRCDICQIELSRGEVSTNAVRCRECNEDLLGDSTTRTHKTLSVKASEKQDRNARRRHHLPEDSDDEDAEGKGEWIAHEKEGRRPKLGTTGDTDDEDTEGGGESLASIDSARSDDNEEDIDDSPSRARLQRHSTATDDSSEEESDDSDDSSVLEDVVPRSSRDKMGLLTGLASSSVTNQQRPSTKIRQLLRILHAEVHEHKTIVFSQFTTMLDLIEPHLRSSGINFERYDGSMRNDAREAALHSLRTNKKTRVLLCSLKCGSLGLNLTAASRVVILEPFWNPFVEEQAIDRVHRLNQTVDVKVFRLTIKDSVEERILALQEKKRELANAAIEGGKTMGKLSMKDILSLFGRDAENSAQDSKDKELWQKFGDDPRLFSGRSDAMTTDSRTKGNNIGGGALKQGGYSNSSQRSREHEVYGRRW